jgi:heat shock protein HslJ
MIGPVLALVLASAESLGVGPPPAPAPSLTGEWRVVSVDGDRPAKETMVGLSFSETDVSGFGGCNRFRGGYVASRESIRISAVAATKTACQRPDDPGAARREARLFAVLDAADHYHFRGERLLITTPTGATLRLERAD